MTQEIRQEARRRERERAQAKAARRRFGADIQAVAGTAEGRRLFSWLLRRGGIFSPDWPDEAGAAAFAAGRRSCAVELWNVLRANLGPEAFAAVALAGAGRGEAAGAGTQTQTESEPQTNEERRA